MNTYSMMKDDQDKLETLIDIYSVKTTLITMARICNNKVRDGKVGKNVSPGWWERTAHKIGVFADDYISDD